MGGILGRVLGRPLLALAAAFALGLAVAPPLAPRAQEACLALGALAFALGGWELGRRRGRGARASALWLAAGLLLGAWRQQAVWRGLQQPDCGRLPKAVITGRVEQDEGVRRETGRASLVLGRVTVAVAGEPARPFDGKIKLAWAATGSETGFGPGDTVRCPAGLRPPQGPDNPGEFDYRGYLLVRGVRGLASAAWGQAPELLERGSAWRPARWAWALRRAMLRGLERAAPQAAALAGGVALGEKRALTRDESEQYGRSGLSYLLAVAGLHLHMALALFLGLARLATSDRRRQAWMGLALALAYVAAAGFPVPALRAGALVLLLLLGRALDLECDAAASLAFGALGILAAQPHALAEAGFQLSFAVTAAILALRAPLAARLGRLGAPAWLAETAAVVVAVQVAAVPLEAWHFSQFTWPAFFSDLAALPLLAPIISLALVCCVLGLVWPPLAAPFALALTGLCKALALATAAMAGLPWAALATGRLGWGFAVAWALAAGLMVLGLRNLAKPGGRGACAAAGGLLLGGLTLWLAWQGTPWARRHPGETRLWVLACGQGDALLLEFGDGRTLLVDGGPARPDAGAWVVAPALKALGVSRLDGVAITHPDADHLGGLDWVLRQVPVGCVYETAWGGAKRPGRGGDGALIASVRGRLRDARIPTRRVWAGQSLPGFPEARVLWPDPALFAARKPPDRNQASLVLGVEDWLVLTGDLPAKQERALAASQGDTLRGRVLKLAHHGSRGSSAAGFLGRVRPALALVSCGKGNRFGFPHPQVLGRLQRMGCPVARTDLQGCVRVVHRSGEVSWAVWH